MGNPSPLRYPGGKYKLYNFVKALVKENDCKTYIEPFGGGSAISLELLLMGDVEKAIINDYDYSIYIFWYSILNNTDEFIKLIENVDISIEEWRKQKNIRLNMEEYTDLEIAFSTFFLNRTNRSGIIDKAGPIGGFEQLGNYKIDCRFNKKMMIDKIIEISNLRDRIKLTNLEALDFIEKEIKKTKKSLTFFDPPYYKKGPGLYTNFYKHGDHDNLSRVINTRMKDRKWIVTYDFSPEIKSMYKKNSNIKFSLQYTLQEKKVAEEYMFFSKKIIRLKNESDFLRMM